MTGTQSISKVQKSDLLIVVCPECFAVLGKLTYCTIQQPDVKSSPIDLPFQFCRESFCCNLVITVQKAYRPPACLFKYCRGFFSFESGLLIPFVVRKKASKKVVTSFKKNYRILLGGHLSRELPQRSHFHRLEAFNANRYCQFSFARQLRPSVNFAIFSGKKKSSYSLRSLFSVMEV